ncbi:MAG TPA: alpha/beta hydrolase [Steroidobacteraceae bacterium]|nr:alpha/beta hydrolase [Steroidobacteraceae bacterium]
MRLQQWLRPATLLLYLLALAGAPGLLRGAVASIGEGAAATGSPGAGNSAAAAAAGAGIRFTPCRLVHPSQILAVDAECGHLNVSENPAAPGGRQIALNIARVPAVSENKRPDPLFLLAGGPGQAATVLYTEVAPMLALIHRDRDIILLDQRGTGGSNFLGCPEDPTPHPTPAQTVTDARDCLAKLATHADPAYYTTSLAVRDLEAVRRALGYAHINLYGASYGTRVAQQYLRRHPAQVRTLILDGVVPPQMNIGVDGAIDAQHSLEHILARCTATPACRQRFGDALATFDAVHRRLLLHPASVSLPDPSTAEPRTLEFGAEDLATVVHIASYGTDQAALLPLDLDQASRGNFIPLAAQLLIYERSLQQDVAEGMYASVICSEDAPGFATADRAALALTYMGTAPLADLAATCSVWPRGPVDPDLHAPLVSATPVLLLSGSDDPVTPPVYAREAAAHLSHALQVVLQGLGHGQVTAPCVDRLMQRFLDTAAVTGLDAELACAERARPAPFAVSFAGPPP